MSKKQKTEGTQTPEESLCTLARQCALDTIRSVGYDRQTLKTNLETMLGVSLDKLGIDLTELEKEVRGESISFAPPPDSEFAKVIETKDYTTKELPLRTKTDSNTSSSLATSTTSALLSTTTTTTTTSTQTREAFIDTALKYEYISETMVGLLNRIVKGEIEDVINTETGQSINDLIDKRALTGLAEFDYDHIELIYKD